MPAIYRRVKMLMIRNMTESDSEKVIEMMKVFYASPAVLSNGSETIFRNDVMACTGNSPYLEGYVFAEGDKILGYSMVAKSFSTEFGKPCIWIEDLYIEAEHRGKGIGTEFFSYIEKKYPGSLIRLEVEEENRSAVRVYEKCGYQRLPYVEMKKELMENVQGI